MAREVNDLEVIDLVKDSVIVDLVNGNADDAKSRKKCARKNQNKNDETSDETMILIIFEDGEQRLVTLNGSHSYNDMPLILETIFPTEKKIKDHLGYKLVNDYIEQRIKISESDDPALGIQYLITVQCATVRLQDVNKFSNLFNSKKFSDVTLCINHKVIYAHKNILANKSSVFETKFDQDMTDIVKIENLDYDTVCDFLYYIYAGKLKKDCTINEFDRYLNLLVAADHYCVESLKEKCEEKLPLLLTTQNVLHCLRLANLHNAAHLKKKAIDFIVGNAEEVVFLPLYKSFIEMHASLSVDITRALVVKKRRTE